MPDTQPKELPEEEAAVRLEMVEAAMAGFRKAREEGSSEKVSALLAIAIYADSPRLHLLPEGDPALILARHLWGTPKRPDIERCRVALKALNITEDNETSTTD